MNTSKIIKEVVDTKECLLIRPRKEDHQKGTAWQYDVKGPFEGNKKGWTLLDLFTASAMLKVFESLRPENQEKFDRLPFQTLVDFTWKHVK